MSSYGFKMCYKLRPQVMNEVISLTGRQIELHGEGPGGVFGNEDEAKLAKY